MALTGQWGYSEVGFLFKDNAWDESKTMFDHYFVFHFIHHVVVPRAADRFDFITKLQCSRHFLEQIDTEALELVIGVVPIQDITDILTVLEHHIGRFLFTSSTRRNIRSITSKISVNRTYDDGRDNQGRIE